MNRFFVFFVLCSNFLAWGDAQAQAPSPPPTSPRVVVLRELREEDTPPQPIKFRHGNCDWLPKMALQAGWESDQIAKLTKISLRESGCCPNRKGGDMVDKNCNITGVSEWNHRSDTGNLQINGINYDPQRNPTAPICLKMRICTQEPLLDPFTNLKAGKLLYDYWEFATGDGWLPWYPLKP